MEQLELLRQEAVAFSFASFALDITMCLIAAFILRKVYVARSISLSGKFHIGNIIPILAVVTFLVIMVVKSSLTLSLGLVGALSVIRFRTPIKEPEELVYLFLAISLGLGYGAHQTVLTTITFAIILAVIWLWLSRSPATKRNEYNVLVTWTRKDVSISQIVDSVVSNENSGDLLKYSSGKQDDSVFLKVILSKFSEIEDMSSRIKSLDETATLSFYEARPLQ
jgi:hypothetical protein